MVPNPEVDALADKFHGHLGSSKWTLCIGAGVSRDIVPTWQELTRLLVNDTFGTTFSPAEFEEHIKQLTWSLDSWIQACANHHRLQGHSSDEIYRHIETHLYGQLRATAKGTGLEDVLVKVLNRPRTSAKDAVTKICNFFETKYSHSTLLQVTRVLLKAIEQGNPPEAIISFNADTLLHTLIELFQRKAHYSGPPPYSHPQYTFKSVLRPLDSCKDLIPIYHCHGAIKPRGLVSAKPPRDARDRLVFLEDEYLRVATTTGSWPETLFLFYAQTTRLVMIGVSMADPNMRRWLSLANQSALQDVAAFSSAAAMTPRHLWLTCSPKEAFMRKMRGEALVHLGVRPAWIANWAQAESAIKNLLAI